MICDKCGQEGELHRYGQLRLCEKCLETSFGESLTELEKAGLIECLGDRVHLTNKGRGAEEIWNKVVEGERICSKCGRKDLFIYPYRGKVYCPECFKPIMEMIDEGSKDYGSGPDDYLLWPQADAESRAVALRYHMVDRMKEYGFPPEERFAFYRCGVFSSQIVNAFRAMEGEKPIWRDEDGESIDREWEEAIQEYHSLVNIPESEQWVPVLKLENGATAVCQRRGLIDITSHEEAKRWLELPKVDMGYQPDGALYGPIALLGKDIIKVIGKQAVPRRDYDPKKHDAFRLSLNIHGNIKQQVHKNNCKMLEGKGLLVDIERPGTAFDVMDRLVHWLPEDLNKILCQAHPIVWTPQMAVTAFQAVTSLNAQIKVESDLLFLNPVLWLFVDPFYEGCRADEAAHPVTEDGHLPFPDEVVGDLGFPVIAILFTMRGGEIMAYYFYMNMAVPALEVRHSHLELGAVPLDVELQTTLKWLRFSVSPYLMVTRQPVERHTRRRTEGKFEHVSKGVGVILLRRREVVYKDSEHRGESRQVDWSCQWWVSGFWRNHWYRSTQTHKYIWIAPYIKGPPDKPLKEAVRLMVR
jgi:hypothetical protein